MATPAFRRGSPDASVQGVFEPSLMPLPVKEDLCRSLLDEFSLPVFRVNSGKHELIIPCRMSASHHNQDHDPTGALNFEKLVYKCLGCGAGGGLLWFIATYRGTSTLDTRKWLETETGVGAQVKELPALLRYFDALYARPERVPIPTYSTRMLEPWMLIHPYLTDPAAYDDKGRSVGGRAIREEDVVRFRVGYDPEARIRVSTDPVTGKGVFKSSERIVIPHFWKGELVGWQSRRLWEDGTPKYVSTPDFPKDTTIYNYDPDAPVAVVVESMATVIKHNHHHHHEATLGADITDSQVKLIGRHPKVVLWLDNDQAGWKNMVDKKDWKGAVTAPSLPRRLAETSNVFAVNNPYAADEDDLGFDRASRLIEEAVPWTLWKPPTMLLCHRCEKPAHEGGC